MVSLASGATLTTLGLTFSTGSCREVTHDFCNMFTPRVDQGGACNDLAASHSFAARIWPQECRVLSCQAGGCPGTCESYVGIGEACSSTQGPGYRNCDPAVAYCDSSSGSPTCKARPKPGEVCNLDTTCTEGYCKDPNSLAYCPSGAAGCTCAPWIALGGACQGAGCKDGYCKSGASVAVCGDTESGCVCAARIPIGGACAGGGCETGPCLSSKCVGPGQTGDVCGAYPDYRSCADGLFCLYPPNVFASSGVCGPLQPAGKPCESSLDCAADLVCRTDNTCGSPGNVGDACNPPVWTSAHGASDELVDCGPGLRCGTSLKCEPRPRLAEPCDSTRGDCYGPNLACGITSHRCESVPGTSTAACDASCAPGYYCDLDAGTCRAAGDNGAACTADEMCASRACLVTYQGGVASGICIAVCQP